MGGSKSTTQVIQPTPPPQPSTAEAIREYVQSLPQIFQAQLEFAPQEAAQQLELAQQFALPLAQTAREAQAELFPETTALQEQLAAEAAAGIEAGVPQGVRDQFLDDFRANLGTNVGSPIGALGTAQALTRLDEDFRRYYRDLALSVSGRQPLAQPQAPGFTSQLQRISPSDVLGFRANNFNTFAQASRPIVSQNTSSKDFLGPAAQLVGSGIGAFAAFCWVAAEVFGGWNHPKTQATRFWMLFKAPKWFRNLYIRHGEKFARFISNKPTIKRVLKPLFNAFAKEGENAIKR